MKNLHKNVFTFIALFCCIAYAKAENNYDTVVAKDGSGDYNSVAAAVEGISSSNFQRYTIFVKNGVYEEKVRIDRNNISLIGESRDKTVIQFHQPQKAWNANKDFEGPAVININADDCIIENLTIQNTMEEIGPTAYVIKGSGTRTIIQNCKLLNNGANTLTLTDYQQGLYYIKNCYIEGTVDFMKAMGWCYIENCQFYQKEAIASIWHAGIESPMQKMVVKNSTFDGVQNFFLGRHHYDAQMYLINCDFTERMADKELYRKTYNNKPEKDKTYLFGDRHYYFNCEMDNGNYAWFADNLDKAFPKITAEKIDASWTFDKQWSPENPIPIEIVDVIKKDDNYIITFNQPITVIGDVEITLANGKSLRFYRGKGRSGLIFKSKDDIKIADIKKIKTLKGKLTNTSASCSPVEFKASTK